MNIPVHKPSKKCKFSSEEDKKLAEVVEKLGAKRWKVIASFIDGKTARQCRDRYTNYLRPDLVFDRWTPEEDLLLIQKYYESDEGKRAFSEWKEKKEVAEKSAT